MQVASIGSLATGLCATGAVFADAVTAPQTAQTVRVKPPVRQVGATVSVTG
nr:MAG: hypothetical protein [Bacteriophage sp.]